MHTLRSLDDDSPTRGEIPDHWSCILEDVASRERSVCRCRRARPMARDFLVQRIPAAAKTTMTPSELASLGYGLATRAHASHLSVGQDPKADCCPPAGKTSPPRNFSPPAGRREDDTAGKVVGSFFATTRPSRFLARRPRSDVGAGCESYEPEEVPCDRFLSTSATRYFCCCSLFSVHSPMNYGSRNFYSFCSFETFL